MSSLRVEPDHPLLAIEPRGLCDWAEWKEAWRSATTFEALSGLLHCGFDVPPVSAGWYAHNTVKATVAERICFYLGVADGYHESDYQFLTEAEQRQADDRNDATKARGKLRQQLALKAFRVLAQKFFRNAARDPDAEPSWLHPVLLEGVLPKVLWFFRLNQFDNIPNLIRSSETMVHTGWAKEFLSELCDLGWTSHHYRYKLGHREQDRFTAIRPELVELLLGLGKITRLLNFQDYPLDDECWRVLEGLAMRPWQMPKPETPFQREVRTPQTAAEAAAHGSAAATVLIALSAIRDERQRFAALVEATQVVASAQRQLSELQGGKQ